jgi:hypothetical protein
MQILTRVWKYNEIKSDVDDDGDSDDEYYVEASKIQATLAMDSLCEFPLQIPSRGEVSVFHSGYVTMISDLITWGERHTWYSHLVKAGMTIPLVFKVSKIVSS